MTVTEYNESVAEEAVAMYWRDAVGDVDGDDLRLPKRWVEHEPREGDPMIDSLSRASTMARTLATTRSATRCGRRPRLSRTAGLCLPCLAGRVGSSGATSLPLCRVRRTGIST